MAIIKLSCPLCGEVDLDAGQIRLQLWRDPAQNNYRFECPACRTTVVKPVTARMLLVLRNQGVKADADDAPPDPTAPAFDHDDLLDFHLALQSDERVAAFIAQASHPSPRDRGRV
jgi:hypothetical protein